MRSIAFAFCLLTAAALPAHAYVVYGMGQMSCRDYLQQRRTPSNTFEIMVVQWTYGQVTAWNALAAKTDYSPISESFSNPSVLAHYDTYCSRFELDVLAKSAESFIKASLERAATREQLGR